MWVIPNSKGPYVQINCQLEVEHMGISGNIFRDNYQHASIFINDLKTDKLFKLTHDALLTDIFDYLE